MFNYETQARNLARGGTIGSVSKNNASQSYRGPGLGQYTPDQLGDGWRMLINLYEDSLKWVQWAIANPPLNPPAWWPVQPQPGPNGAPPDFDPAVYQRMNYVFQGAVNEYQVDLTDLRLHPVLTGQGGVLCW